MAYGNFPCGHPRDETNTYIQKTPYIERCKLCHRACMRLYRRRLAKKNRKLRSL
jgi:hypothetical protein